MLIYRIPRGEFKGGAIRTRVNPTLTHNSYEHNNFIIEIKQTTGE